MFPRRYYPARMFAPRFFPQSQGAAPPATDSSVVIRLPISQSRIVRVNISSSNAATIPISL